MPLPIAHPFFGAQDQAWEGRELGLFLSLGKGQKSRSVSPFLPLSVSESGHQRANFRLVLGPTSQASLNPGCLWHISLGRILLLWEEKPTETGRCVGRGAHLGPLACWWAPGKIMVAQGPQARGRPKHPPPTCVQVCSKGSAAGTVPPGQWLCSGERPRGPPLA